MAPIILIGQNRQEEKDRDRSNNRPPDCASTTRIVGKIKIQIEMMNENLMEIASIRQALFYILHLPTR